jgi:hypothetical protein
MLIIILIRKSGTATLNAIWMALRSISEAGLVQISQPSLLALHLLL